MSRRFGTIVKNKNYTYEDVKNNIERLGFELLSPEYINNDKYLRIKCVCGNIMEKKYSDIIRRDLNCSVCGKPKMTDRRQKRYEELIDMLSSKGYFVVEEINFKNRDQKILVNDALGYKYLVTIGYAAYDNEFRKFHPSNPFSLYNIDNWISQNERSFIMLSEKSKYETCNSLLIFKCSLCLEEWDMDWEHIISGQGCPYCSGKRIIWKNSIEATHPGYLCEWNYEKNTIKPSEISRGSGKMVWWKCHNCSYEWQNTPDTRIGMGVGCPNCWISRGELKILSILMEKDINYIREYRFNDCKFINTLEFDFAIFSDREKKELKLLLEYQGEQHYWPVDFANRGSDWAKENFDKGQKRDAIKEKYCEDNGITLVKIPYWNFNDIKNILKEIL
jgi:DNA-directed RNA polymerase subunit RPC12/RpoP